MIRTLIHASENDNLYIYDHQFRLSILVHPEFRKAYEGSPDVHPYYLKKYEYLRKQGFFSKSKPVNFGTVNESMIKNNMAEVPQIVFETTDFCNLNCTYCALGDVYEGFDVRNQKKINTEHAITLLKYILDIKHKSKKNQLYISFFGGEPLFNGDFIKQIVEVANLLKSEKEIEIRYTMTTNATLLNKYIPFLVDNEFELLISLDGNEVNHSYRSYRGNKKNSFEKVIENIDMLQRDYPEYFINHVNFNAVLHNRNSVKDIYEFIYSRYHKIPRIAELNPCDVSPNKEELFNKMFHDKRKSEAEYIKDQSNHLPHEEMLQYKELTDFLKKYSINYYVSNIIDLFPGEKKYLPTSTCLPFWKKLMLTTNSKLALCEKVSYHKLTVGEVGETVMIDVPKITRQYNFYYEHVKEKCQQCYANKSCDICMFVMNNSNLNKLDAEEFKCEGFHDLGTFDRKLHRVFSFLEKYPEDNLSITENVVIV
ncbi:radical SAM peptide maturase [Parabacteroides faecis]|uniref:radical SAM peptide maturase n=1 Tax=Parabacteroides faecis TaxID=1217282 RepID=UPI0035223C51